MIRKTILLFALSTVLFGLSSISLASEQNGDAVVPPDKLVEQTATQLLTKLSEHKDKYLGNPEAVYALVQAEMAPHFDFTYAARLVLGQHWRDASEEQRAAFIDAFKHYLVSSYANELVKHADAKVKFEPFRGSPTDDRAIIGSRIIPKSGTPISVGYAMHRTDEGWKVFDVRAEGVSYVMSYRNTFDSEIRQTSLDALIERLRNKAEVKTQKASQPDASSH